MADLKPYYESEGVILYHGDARLLFPQIRGYDLILTDPPYGINWIGHPCSTKEWNQIPNDDGNLDLRPVLTAKCRVVAFGANNYPDQLPHRGRWICWDKRVNPNADKMLGSPFELAWTNTESGFDKMYRIQHGGVINADGPERRVHSTQKPVCLMQKIIAEVDCTCVFDPFTGSGTTLIAAKLEGKQGIGIEINERDCEKAAIRLDQRVLFG